MEGIYSIDLFNAFISTKNDLNDYLAEGAPTLKPITTIEAVLQVKTIPYPPYIYIDVQNQTWQWTYEVQDHECWIEAEPEISVHLICKYEDALRYMGLISKFYELTSTKETIGEGLSDVTLQLWKVMSTRLEDWEEPRNTPDHWIVKIECLARLILESE